MRPLDTHNGPNTMNETFTMKCPLDAQMKFEVPPELATYEGHCTTTKPNRTCPFIKHGCTGCEFKTPFRGLTEFLAIPPKNSS